jgi:hypothetical protein
VKSSDLTFYFFKIIPTCIHDNINNNKMVGHLPLNWLIEDDAESTVKLGAYRNCRRRSAVATRDLDDEGYRVVISRRF